MITGKNQMAKKAGRKAKEGLVAVHSAGNKGVVSSLLFTFLLPNTHMPS
jgi:translation elongation factor EF-Ts